MLKSDVNRSTLELCACGLPLHYADPIAEAWVRRLIAQEGEFITVTTPEGTWKVPRHFIALHGLRAADLPKCNFERIEP
jgi:hypothetical protein